jgi:hypothetical protein
MRGIVLRMPIFGSTCLWIYLNRIEKKTKTEPQGGNKINPDCEVGGDGRDVRMRL